MKMPRLRATTLILLGACMFLSSCQAVQELAALRNVAFNIDRVAGVRLAGIDVEQVRSYSDLRVPDVLRLTQAISRQELPLALTIHVNAENPQENPVTARLFKLDWTLLLDETETISGIMDTELELPPGQPQVFPVSIELDLIKFFDKNARDLFDLARAIAGEEGAASRIQLRGTPTVSTPIGPIRYPNPVTIVSAKVGN